VLEAVFVLWEFSSPSRRIFIGSHSLPPSLVRRIGPSKVLKNINSTIESFTTAMKNQLSFNKMIETLLAQLASSLPSY
jgi:hypothetical protein